MKRLILKSKDEPVEIHIVGESAITHASYMLDCGISNHFFGVCLDDVPSWNQHLITPAFMEHTYVDGKEIQLGHQVEIEIAKGVFKRGTIKFQQQAYCFASQESGAERYTPLCCFSNTVKFHRIK